MLTGLLCFFFDFLLLPILVLRVQDPKVNRLQDSLLLWKEVVSNKLLANVNIILFLNKCDLLKAKLAAGVQLVRHMPNYRDRPNDYESIRQCTLVLPCSFPPFPAFSLRL